MKNLICALLLIIPIFGMAQSKSIAQFYNKYKKLENVTDIKLQGWVLKLASQFADEEEAERLLKKITHLRVMVMEEGNLVSPFEYKELVKSIRKESFEDLIQIKEDGQNIQCMIREEGDTITDVLLLVSGSDEFILLSLEGALKLSDLNDLHIDIDGAEHFEKLPEKKKKVPRA